MTAIVWPRGLALWLNHDHWPAAPWSKHSKIVVLQVLVLLTNVRCNWFTWDPDECLKRESRLMMSEGNFERSSQKTTCGLNSSPQTTTCRSTLYTPPAKVRPWAKFIEVQNFALVVHLSSELGQVSVCCKFSHTCCRNLAKHVAVCCEGGMKRMNLVHLSWKFSQLPIYSLHE